MDKKYVVSADIYLLLKNWAATMGFVLPPQEFFSELRQEFCRFMTGIFPNFELVSEEELQIGLADLLRANHLPVISLDRVYTVSDFHIDITRLVDENLKKLEEYGQRGGKPLIDWELDEIKNAQVSEAVLADDVIWEGKNVKEAITRLEQVNVRIKLVCSGIGVDHGLNDLQKQGIEIRCVRKFSDLIDEICERDFYPGVPLSGLTIKNGNNTGAPYLLPFGKPKDWASIPEEFHLNFSRFCLTQTICLFENIEKVSDRQVLRQDLERKVHGLPKDNWRFVTQLRQAMQRLTG